MGAHGGTRLRWLILLGFLGTLFSGACGSSSENPKPPLTDDETYCAEVATATCTWARSCCELGELQQVLGLTSSDAYSVELVRQAQANDSRCRDIVHSSCVTANRDLMESIRTNRVTLDRAALQACLTELTRASTACDVGLARGPTVTKACALDQIFIGNAKTNDPCFHELDCATGFFCWRAGSSSDAGICRPVVQGGQACRDSTKCDLSSVCVPVATRTEKCAPLDLQMDGGFCTSDALCGATSFCNSATFTCDPKGDGGQECNRPKHCLSGRCNLDQRQCLPRRPAGEPCSSQSECQDGLWCNPAYASSSCSRPLQTGDAGDQCSSTAPCGAGLVCVGNFCQLPLDIGQLCTSDAQCNAASYCSRTTNVCVSPRKQVDQSCTRSRECAADLYCSGLITQTCRPRIILGESCLGAPDACAQDTRCDPFTDTCKPLLPVGEPCSSAGDCESGLLCESFAGQCDTKLMTSAPCDQSSSCPTAEYCSSTGAVLLCQQPAPVDEGQRCGSSSVACRAGLYCGSDLLCHRLGGANDSCTQDNQCDMAFFCNLTTDVCTALRPVGGTCSSDSQCAAGLYCSSLTTQCRAHANLGEVCSTSSFATAPTCSPGLNCTLNALTLMYSCTALPGAGQSCLSSSGCATGLYCNATFICTALGMAGQSCNSTSQCVKGLNCDSTTHLCVNPKAAGEQCKSSIDCQTGLTCHSYSGTCSPRTAAGGSCIADQQCVQGYECLLDSTCEARAALNEKCDTDHPCAPGLRCDTEWGVCRTLEGPFSSGLRCHVSEECLSGSCIDHICTGACQGLSL
ncbi:MAG TPA: Dickkopf N-terminal cysteine-rich domain-containing protein [Polyangiaceae bacterium]